MARVVCIHGIAQEFESRETLLNEWAPALCGGVSNYGGRLDPVEIDMAFYGILFRKKGKGVLDRIPQYAPGDLADPLEIALLNELFDSAVTSAADVVPAKALGKRTVGSMLQVLGRTPFFGNVAQNVVIWYLKQVLKYVKEPETNEAARQALLQVLHDDTRVIVSHSLGTVVAYEVLCANPKLPVRTLITLGSPLGLPALGPQIKPVVTGSDGEWPHGLEHWFNIADASDIVALIKDLAPIFGARVVDHLVYNGATMHNIKPYLTSRELGSAIVTALA